MAFELKDGQGTLFMVKDKEGNDKRPDREGQLMLGGQLYRVAGWLKQGQSGQWLSLKVELPRAKEADKPSVAKYVDAKPPAYGPDGEVPF